ncbi:MAG: sodium:solute symporter family protein [Acidobacteriota bacterium]|nr:MAG: sodium:solute symporter family protein [Acidobacteriota bacterium]
MRGFEASIVLVYLFACVAIGLFASRRALGSSAEYWVAGRRIGTVMNSLAIMAALASGGSFVGILGLAYSKGVPYAFSLFAGAILGFPLAALLVAKPLRNFGRFTVTDFLAARFPHGVVRTLVPVLIVATFTMYTVAQMKTAGLAASFLFGISFRSAVTLSALVFILYVSMGGMLAVTWTDMLQGFLMLSVVWGLGGVLIARYGTPAHLMERAVGVAPSLGTVAAAPASSYIGSFVIWSAAICIIPHIIMRVYTAKDAHGARLSLNVAMLLYSLMIIMTLLVLVPVGKTVLPALKDADMLFFGLVDNVLGPVMRGFAVAALMASVMSTTDALLLACSSAIGHDLLGGWIKRRGSEKLASRVAFASTWAVGLLAMVLAYDPPELITRYYTEAVGLLTAGLFVPTVAGLWWKRANTAGGAAALVTGAAVFLAGRLLPDTPSFASILYALPASAVAMAIGSYLGCPPEKALLDRMAELHR